LSFYSKVKIQEESENNMIVITERPAISTSTLIDTDEELIGERNCKIEIKLVRTNELGPFTKIKILYKYLDQSSINYAANELLGSSDQLEQGLYKLKSMIENQK